MKIDQIQFSSKKSFGKAPKVRVVTTTGAMTQTGTPNKNLSFKGSRLNNETKNGAVVFGPGLRWNDRANGIMIFERKPALKGVMYYFATRRDKLTAETMMATIALPWQVYVVQYGVTTGNIINIYTYWRNSQLRGLDSAIGQPWIPNLYDDGKVCLPNETLERTPGSTIGSLMDRAYQAVWDGVFNRDIMPSTTAQYGLTRAVQYGTLTEADCVGVWRKARSHAQMLLPTVDKTIDQVLAQYWVPPELGHVTTQNHRDSHGDPVKGDYHVPLRSVLRMIVGGAPATYLQQMYRVTLSQAVF